MKTKTTKQNQIHNLLIMLAKAVEDDDRKRSRQFIDNLEELGMTVTLPEDLR